MLLLFSLLLVLFLLFSHPSAFSPLYSVHEVINIDLNHPEQNGQFLVVPFMDIEKDGALQNCYEIMIVDSSLQDFLHDKYKAWKIRSNELLISMPSAPYHYLEEFSEFFEELKKVPGNHCKCVQLGHDVACNAIINDDTHHLKHILLHFLKEVVLNCWNYADSEGELTCEWCSYENTFWVDGCPFTREYDVLFWMIRVEEESSRVILKHATDTMKGAAMLAHCFASMSTN